MEGPLSLIPGASWLTRRSNPWIVLAVSLALTGAGAWYLEATTKAKDRLRFRSLADKTTNSISRKVETYIALLRATSSLFATSRNVGLGEFRAFVEGIELREQYPGIQGIGYSARISS